MSELEANLQSVQARIAAAASRARRDPKSITLVAVTKAQSPVAIRAAYDLGIRHFGENRVEEAEAKVGTLPRDITWHMIGHIQSRKASRVGPLFDLVHSVDSLKLARRLDRLTAERAKPLPVLLECNVSGEETKYGFDASAWTKNGAQRQTLMAAMEEIVALPNLQVQGLMTMAPIVADPEQARPVFVRLRQLRDELAKAFPGAAWRDLSMGMTDDFEVAVEEGATLVRVGRAIFEPALPPWRKGAI
ncbi:MAG TPA: YggS family pyridoxal phosphate-dependent enzyme [Anaerolineae bacterium]|nr:YggS family pyridoxal phosphate-dependent enzyme [Anaerolineae bacterium]